MKFKNLASYARALLFTTLVTIVVNNSARAGVHTWTGAVNGAWSNAGNWSGGAPGNLELPPIQLIFPATLPSAFLNTTNDLPLVDCDQMIIQGSGYTFYATGNATNYNLNNNDYISVTGANNTFSTSLNLSLDGTNVTIYTAPGITFTILGTISGNNGYTKTGMGELLFTGSLPNSFLGTTHVQAGTLTLNKDNGVVSVPGSLFIGSNVATNSAIAKALTDGQILDDNQLEVYDNGTLNMNGHSTTFATAYLRGGVVTTGAGLLTLGGSVSVDFSTMGNSSISGKLSLGSSTRNFNINSGILDISAIVSSSGGIRPPGITKYGSGLLTLSGANTYTGPTTINQGTLEISSDSALGSTNNGTVVASGGALRLTDVHITDEPLSIEGLGGGFSPGALQFDKTNIWNGPVTLTADAVLNGLTASAKLSIGAAISGAGGITLTNNGTLVFNGSDANTYGGTTVVAKGKLLLAKSYLGFGMISIPAALTIGNVTGSSGSEVVQLLASHQIGNAAPVTVRHTGLLDLNGNSDTVGHLFLEDGQVATGVGTLTLNGNLFAPLSGTFQNSVSGKLALNGARVFNVSAGATLQMLAEVTDGGVASDLTLSGLGAVNLSASNSFSGTVYLGQGRLTMGHTNSLGTTNGGTVVSGGELAIGSLFNINEPLTLSGFGTGQGALLFLGTNIWNGPVTFNGTAGISPLSSSSQISFNGFLSGSGNIVATNGGTYILAGGQPNDLTGTTILAGNASLRLAKVSNGAGTNAIGSLMIGDATTNKDLVLLQGNNQINTNASVAIYGSGTLDMQNWSCSFNDLVLSNSYILANAGLLSLKGGVSGMGQCGVAAKVRLEPATTISVNAGALVFSGEVKDWSGPANITKIGDGYLGLSASNSFSGILTVSEGAVTVSNPYSLGTTSADTVIQSGASLSLANVTNLMENISLSGTGMPSKGTLTVNSISTNSLAGKITLSTDITIETFFTNQAIYLNGIIDGPGGFKKIGPGSLRLGGTTSNSYLGKTILSDGLLELSKTNALAVPGQLILTNGIGGTARLLRNNQIEDNTQVAVAGAYSFDLNGFSETIASLTGTGTVTLGTGVLTVGGDNSSTTFNGLITGNGGPLQTQLIKTGNGTLTLKGNNTYTGDTMLLGGKLIVDGNQTGPVDVLSPAVLGGNGKVGAVTSTSGVISPGSSPGKLTTGNLSLNSTSTLLIELNGTAATNYDQLSVIGTVSLNGNLTPSVNFNSALSNQFVILQNDGNDAISGTFNNLPEGATFNIGNRQFKISYVGGDGNDVVLTQVSASGPSNFSSVTRLPNGDFVFNGTGAANSQYSIDVSTDLKTWNFLMSVTTDANGSFMFTDIAAKQYPSRFYRLLGP